MTASILGVSACTLQRRLQRERTTYQAEAIKAKLVAATTWMRAGRSNLTAIAYDLGFASLQHFSTRFRGVYGMSPSEWQRTQHDEGATPV